MFTLTQILTTSKACRQTGVNLFVTFLNTMVQDGGPSLAQLKRELDSLSHNLLNIDLQIQGVKQGQPNPNSLQTLEQARAQIKEQVIQKQVQFELKKAQNKRQ